MPRSRSVLILAALALTALSGSASGEEIAITGRVTDGAGKGLEGIAIQLKASHSTLSLRRMSRIETHPTYLSTLTDSRGDFGLTWTSHEFYDRFSIAAGLRLGEGEGSFEEVQRVDVSDRMNEPGGVVVSIEIERTPRLDRYLAFVATIDSEDQQRVFEQMGQPDKTDHLQVAGQEEVTWWYFRRGKAYRFEGGRLDLVIPFEPVES